jgi:pyruvate,orthophosphate dikinase
MPSPSEVIGETGVDITYLVGTMIELPRAAIRAHAIAEVAEFFSFGTNDLTQTTFGISRDDASSFLMTYQQKGIIEQDPFVTLDIDGVGELVRIASDKGRATRPDIKLGICGEHGGDPASVKFCEQIGLDYVSCSPFRVPIARLAAAQAASNIPEFRRRINQSWRPGCKSGPSHRSRWIVFCRYISWRLKQWTSSL